MPLDVSLACPDWWEKMQRGETPIAPIPLNKARAATATAIFNDLRLPDQEGFPRLETAAGQWFRDIVTAALASEHPETKGPVVTEIFTLVPKKSSKTTYTAALALTAMMVWVRPNAQMLLLAPTKEIANRLFNQAAGMIRLDPRLRKIFHVKEHKHQIIRIKTGATLQVKTFSMDVVTGEIPALTIIDELHVLAAKPDAERIIAQITGGSITASDSLIIYITTQSDVPPAGIFETKLNYARAVRDGEITDGKMLPVLYEFPAHVQSDEDKPWTDPKLWHFVMPNMGRSQKLDKLIGEYGKAKREGQSALTIWSSQHLNIQVGLGLHMNRWAGALHWLAAQDAEQVTLDRILDECEVVTIGIDGGGLDDLAGMSVVGRVRGSGDWLHLEKAWAHPEVFERHKLIASTLEGFVRDGDLVLCEDPLQAVEEITAICGSVHAAQLLPKEEGIGVDQHTGLANLTTSLGLIGIEPPLLTHVPQTWKMSQTITTLPVMLKARVIRHSLQPLMVWCVGNAKQVLRSNNYYVTKEAAGRGKIDPLMAFFDAANLMLKNPSAEGDDFDDYVDSVLRAA